MTRSAQQRVWLFLVVLLAALFAGFTFQSSAQAAVTRDYSHSLAPAATNNNGAPFTFDRWPNINRRAPVASYPYTFNRGSAANGYPVHPSDTYSARYEVRKGDKICASGGTCSISGERVESAEPHPGSANHAKAGQDHYYSMSFWLPDGSRPGDGTWQLNDSGYRNLVQWKSIGQVAGGDPIALLTAVPASGNNAISGFPGGIAFTSDLLPKAGIVPNPVPLGQWLDFIVYAKWSAGTDGQLKFYYRPPGGSFPAEGSPTLTRNGKNMNASSDSIWHRAGMYRGNFAGTSPEGGNPTVPTIVYHADHERSDTFSEAIAELSGTIPGDTTPPTVTSRQPAPDSTGNPVNTNMEAGFSEAIDPATVNGSTFYVNPAAGGSSFPGTITASEGNTLFSLDLTDDLAAGTQYRVHLTNGIKDTAGNPLTAESWTFTTQVQTSTTQTFSEPSPMSGRIAWEAFPDPSTDVEKVDFYVDGALSHTELAAPYVLTTDGGYDTAQLADEDHEFKVVTTYTATSGKPSSQAAEVRATDNVVEATPVTYGVATEGALYQAATANAKRGFVVSVTQRMEWQSFRIYVQGSANPTKMRAVLYALDTSNNPTTRIHSGAEATVAANQPKGVMEIPQPNLIVEPGNYLLTMHSDGGGATYSYNTCGTLRWGGTSSDSYTDGPSDPFGPANTDTKTPAFSMSGVVAP